MYRNSKLLEAINLEILPIFYTSHLNFLYVLLPVRDYNIPHIIKWKSALFSLIIIKDLHIL